MTIETLKSPNARNRNRLYFRGKIEIFIRLFDEHFARHFESHWRETWRHTGRRTVPQISLETPSPLATTFYEREIGSAAQDPIKWSGCPQSKPMSQG